MKGIFYMHNQNDSDEVGVEDTVSIPMSVYNKFIRNDTLFQMILLNRNKQPWELAGLVNMAYEIAAQNDLAESEADSDA